MFRTFYLSYCIFIGKFIGSFERIVRDEGFLMKLIKKQNGLAIIEFTIVSWLIFLLDFFWLSPCGASCISPLQRSERSDKKSSKISHWVCAMRWSR